MQHSRGTQLDERRTREEEYRRAHLAQMWGDVRLEACVERWLGCCSADNRPIYIRARTVPLRIAKRRDAGQRHPTRILSLHEVMQSLARSATHRL
jgi:hypothetical protein